MKLSNTLMMNEMLLPSNKKAFTLAEVLITLSILGIVAALTIPSLVNRNSDIAAQVKLKKAISNYEDVVGVFLVENETTNAGATSSTNGSTTSYDYTASLMNETCGNASSYFKILKQNGCTFTTADGAQWTFEPKTGSAYVQDSENNPRFGVTMWALNGQVNGVGSTDQVSNVPSGLFIPQKPLPLHGVYAAGGTNSFINSKLSDANQAPPKLIVGASGGANMTANPASLAAGASTQTPGLSN